MHLNPRQASHILLALVSCLLGLLPNSLVLPGWHLQIPYLLDSNPFFIAIFFLLITLLYGTETGKALPRWYFWVHLLLSLACMLYSPVRFSFFPISIDKIDFSFIERESVVVRWVSYLFLANQLVLVLFLFFRQWQSGRASGKRRTSTGRPPAESG